MACDDCATSGECIRILAYNRRVCLECAAKYKDRCAQCYRWLSLTHFLMAADIWRKRPATICAQCKKENIYSRL